MNNIKQGNEEVQPKLKELNKRVDFILEKVQLHERKIQSMSEYFSKNFEKKEDKDIIKQRQQIQEIINSQIESQLHKIYKFWAFEKNHNLQTDPDLDKYLWELIQPLEQVDQNNSEDRIKCIEAQIKQLSDESHNKYFEKEFLQIKTQLNHQDQIIQQYKEQNNQFTNMNQQQKSLLNSFQQQLQEQQQKNNIYENQINSFDNKIKQLSEKCLNKNFEQELLQIKTQLNHQLEQINTIKDQFDIFKTNINQLTQPQENINFKIELKKLEQKLEQDFQTQIQQISNNVENLDKLQQTQHKQNYVGQEQMQNQMTFKLIEFDQFNQKNQELHNQIDKLEQNNLNLQQNINQQQNQFNIIKEQFDRIENAWKSIAGNNNTNQTFQTKQQQNQFNQKNQNQNLQKQQQQFNKIDFGTLQPQKSSQTQINLQNQQFIQTDQNNEKSIAGNKNTNQPIQTIIQLNSQQTNQQQNLFNQQNQNQNLLQKQSQIKIQTNVQNQQFIQTAQQQDPFKVQQQCNQQQIQLNSQQEQQGFLNMNQFKSNLKVQPNNNNEINSQQKPPFKQDIYQFQNRNSESQIDEIQLFKKDQVRCKKVQNIINKIYQTTTYQRSMHDKYQQFIREVEDFHSLCKNYGIKLIQQRQQLKELCNSFRQVRGDGNCFYTAFGFQVIQIIIGEYSTQQFQDFVNNLNGKFKCQIIVGNEMFYGDEFHNLIYNEFLFRIEQFRQIKNKEERIKQFIQHFQAFEQLEDESIDGCLYGLSTIFFKNLSNYLVSISDQKDLVTDQETILLWEKECNSNEFVISLLANYLQIHIKLLFFNHGNYQLRQYNQNANLSILLLIQPGHYNIGIKDIDQQQY
ncbi:unnamed protein product [Paramecium sonneborni]|uniref:OTU domain-containing protein n=1 Tax=Paramecium sonneborni TaxID=65129 RepID=A0A8S1QTW3_9CILI|nr:unnamed protein product [Paramecium sonneborni]